MNHRSPLLIVLPLRKHIFITPTPFKNEMFSHPLQLTAVFLQPLPLGSPHIIPNLPHSNSYTALILCWRLPAFCGAGTTIGWIYKIIKTNRNSFSHIGAEMVKKT